MYNKWGLGRIPWKDNGFNQDLANLANLLANQVSSVVVQENYIPLAKILISFKESTTTLYKLCGN